MSKLLGQRLNDNLMAYTGIKKLLDDLDNAGYVDLIHTLLSNIKNSQAQKDSSNVLAMNEPLKVILCNIVDIVWDLAHDPLSKSILDIKYSEETELKSPSYDEYISKSPYSDSNHFDSKKHANSLRNSPTKKTSSVSKLSNSDVFSRSSLGSPKNEPKRKATPVIRLSNSEVFSRSSISSPKNVPKGLSESVSKSGYLERYKRVSSKSKSDLSLISDFSYIKGHSTFSKEKRRITEVKVYSPGPATYEYEVLHFRDKSPRVMISRGGKRIDFVMNDSPGPAEYYPLRHFISK